MRAAVAGLAAAFLGLLAVVLSIAAVFGADASGCGTVSASASDVQGLPAAARRFVPLYVAAADRYGLGERGAPILAAIHSVESGFGSNMGPSTAGAVGHMQFLAATWDAYGVDADEDGRADPYDAADAIYSAANYLHASGAPADWAAAIFAYNHADWYVDEVLRTARRFGDLAEVVDAVCAASGPAELDRAVRIYAPARDLRIPSQYMAPGHPPALIDARIWPDVRWTLKNYELAITAGKETGHASHGDGSAIDAVPAGSQAVSNWERTAERAARDFGWTAGCASAGVRPACPLIPAIEFIGYNGYSDGRHGDPAHTTSPHIHISWVSSTHGTPYLTTPEWVLVFPVPGEP